MDSSHSFDPLGARDLDQTGMSESGQLQTISYPLILRPHLGVEWKNRGHRGHSCPNVRFWPDAKNMNTERRLPTHHPPFEGTWWRTY